MLQMNDRYSEVGQSIPLPFGLEPSDAAGLLAHELADRDGEDYLLYECDGQWILGIAPGPVSNSTRVNYGSTSTAPPSTGC
ncbi:hypothetical protein [Mycolicibacterium insubricum]|uniref:hypothetical protein n=1 Tax=Mycolicibacterium insubricum TaxID=444597 RepID=UPI0021F331B4|nr:hypothetical protein [Mycolicibacterium insubricum]